MLLPYRLSLTMIAALLLFSCGLRKNPKAFKTWKRVPIVNDQGDTTQSLPGLIRLIEGRRITASGREEKLVAKVAINPDSTLLQSFYRYQIPFLDLSFQRLALPDNTSLQAHVTLPGGRVMQSKQYFSENYMGNHSKRLFHILMKHDQKIQLQLDFEADSSSHKTFQYAIDPGDLKAKVKKHW